MIKALTIIAALLATQAHAQPTSWTIESTAGGTYTVLPKSARAYEKINGTLQIDALTEVKPYPAAEQKRFRIGVTGCAEQTGQLGFVNHDGKPMGEPMDWVEGGSKVPDMLAELICLAGVRAAQGKLRGAI